MKPVKPENRFVLAVIFLLVVGLALRIGLLLRGPASGIYNTDELIMFWSTVGLLFNATPTQLVWPGTSVQMLAYPVVMIDLVFHGLAPHLGGGFKGLMDSMVLYLADNGFSPLRLLSILRTVFAILSLLPLLIVIPFVNRPLSKPVLLWFVLLSVLSPLWTTESLMFKSDGLGYSLFVAALLLTLYGTSSYHKGWDLALAGAAAVMGVVLATRLTVLPFLIVPFGVLVLRHIYDPRARSASWFKPVPSFLLMAGAFLLALLAFFPQIWTDSPTFAKTFFGNYLAFDKSVHPDHLLLFKYSPRWIGLLGLPFMIWGAILFQRKYGLAAALMLLASVLLLSFPLLKSNSFFDRHTLQLVPFAALLAAVGLVDIYARIPRWGGMLIAIVLVAWNLEHTVLRHEIGRQAELVDIAAYIDSNLGRDAELGIPYNSNARTLFDPDSTTAAEIAGAYASDGGSAVMNRFQSHFGKLDSSQYEAFRPLVREIFGEDDAIQSVRYSAMGYAARQGLAPKQGRRQVYYIVPPMYLLMPGIRDTKDALEAFLDHRLDAIVLTNSVETPAAPVDSITTYSPKPNSLYRVLVWNSALKSDAGSDPTTQQVNR